MSKKHFIALADALRAQKPADHWDPKQKVQWELDVKAVASICAHFNYNFNRDLWMRYVNGECGPSGEAIKEKRQ